MKNSSMVTRTISGVVLLIIVLICGFIGGGALLLFTGAAGVIGLYELYMALGLYNKNAESKADNRLAVTALVFAVIFYLVVGLGIVPLLVINAKDFVSFDSGNFINIISDVDRLNMVVTLMNIFVAFLFIILMLIIFVGIYVFSFPRFDFTKVAYVFTGFVYVPVFMSFVYLTRTLTNGKYVFWLIFICSWVCDTCAYFAGSFLGKHKLAPVLSPKKSIEGSIGGIVGSVLIAFLFGYFIEYKMLGGQNNAVGYMIICLFGSIVSQIGDLVASGIKRNHNIKDYGNVIPGHGGILDRFDSVLFVAPVIFFLAMFVI